VRIFQMVAAVAPTAASATAVAVAIRCGLATIGSSPVIVMVPPVSSGDTPSAAISSFSFRAAKSGA